MKLRRLHLLPGLLFLLVMVTFAVTYVIAVCLDHVKPDFPYISDTGTEPPESCIFAQFINIAAFLLLGCVYVRYLQVEAVIKRAGDSVQVPPRCNRVSAWMGVLACLGLDMVANFQEGNVLVVHMIGAFMCFLSATIFFCMQTYISRKLMSQMTSTTTFYIRVLISTLCIILSILTIVPGTVAMKEFDGDFGDAIKWRPEDGGWTMHLISTISEWLLVICFCSFIASFSGEFKGVSLEGPFIQLPPSTKSQSTTQTV